MTNQQKQEFWSSVDDWTLQRATEVFPTWEETEREIIRREMIKRKLKEI